MVNKCIYCGQDLLSEDARFCHICGHMQIQASSPATEAAPTRMKVKLPPKEFTRMALPPTPQQESLPPTSPRESFLAPQSEEPLSFDQTRRTIPQNSQDYLARTEQFKGPVGFMPIHSGTASADKFSAREAPGWLEDLGGSYPLLPPTEQSETQEPSIADDLPPTPRAFPETFRNAQDVYDPNDFTRTEFSSPASSDKISSISIPNWRAEAEANYEERARLYPSYAPENLQASIDQDLPPTPRQPRPSPTGLPAMTSPSEQRNDSHSSAPSSWSNSYYDERTRSTEALQRALEAREWEQPDQPPFSGVSDVAGDMASLNTMHQLPQPPMDWSTPVNRSPMAQLPLSPFPAIPDPDEDMASLNTMHQLPQPSMDWSTPVKKPALTQAPFTAFPATLEEQLDLEEDIATLDTVHEKAITLKKEGPLGTMPDAQPDPLAPLQDDMESVEDLPTLPLAIPEEHNLHPQIVIERASTPAPKKNVQRQAEEHIEDLPTRKMPTIPPSAVPRTPVFPAAQQPSQYTPGNSPTLPPGLPRSVPPGQSPVNPPSFPGASQLPEQTVRPDSPSGPAHNLNALPEQGYNPPSQPGLPSGPAAQSSNTSARPENLRAQAHGQSAFPSISISTPDTPQPDPAQIAAALKKSPGKKRKNRWPIVAILLVLLLAGGAALYQYITVTFTPQPDQPYQNNALGFSLRYPQGWETQTNQAKQQITFIDSSHTGQVIVQANPTNGQALNQYTSSESSQLNVTGTKTLTPVSFAGATWQQTKGVVTQEGVTYTITLYTTQRNEHFYTLACLAPPSSYDGMEQDDFSPLRASFTFL